MGFLRNRRWLGVNPVEGWEITKVLPCGSSCKQSRLPRGYNWPLLMEKLYVTHRGPNWPLLMEMLHHSQGAQSDLYLWKMLHHSRGPQLIFINGKTLRHSWGAPTDLYWWKNLTSLTRGPDWPLLMEKRYVNHRGPLRSLDLYQLIYINLNICGEEFSGFPSLFCVLFKINTHQTFKDTRPKPAYGRQGLDWNYNGPPLIQKRHVTHGGPQPTF